MFTTRSSWKRKEDWHQDSQPTPRKPLTQYDVKRYQQFSGNEEFSTCSSTEQLRHVYTKKLRSNGSYRQQHHTNRTKEGNRDVYCPQNGNLRRGDTKHLCNRNSNQSQHNLRLPIALALPESERNIEHLLNKLESNL